MALKKSLTEADLVKSEGVPTGGPELADTHTPNFTPRRIGTKTVHTADTKHGRYAYAKHPSGKGMTIHFKDHATGETHVIAGSDTHGVSEEAVHPIIMAHHAARAISAFADKINMRPSFGGVSQREAAGAVRAAPRPAGAAQVAGVRKSFSTATLAKSAQVLAKLIHARTGSRFVCHCHD